VNNLHLQIVKLQSYELLPTLNFVSNESLNNSVNEESSDIMPIVKNSNGENSQENGCGGGGVDKGIFSVSRVKKVELSEIPLASDICSTRKFFTFPTIIYAHFIKFCIYILIAPSSTTDQPSMTMTSSTTPIQHSFNTSSVNGSGGSSVMKNGSVLHRVITLTTADSNLSSSRTLSKPPIPPTYVPEKLHFSAYEKFEGNISIFLKYSNFKL
jgi:hypothetical protein